jgi:hypothetical protein
VAACDGSAGTTAQKNPKNNSSAKCDQRSDKTLLAMNLAVLSCTAPSDVHGRPGAVDPSCHQDARDGFLVVNLPVISCPARRQQAPTIHAGRPSPTVARARAGIAGLTPAGWVWRVRQEPAVHVAQRFGEILIGALGAILSAVGGQGQIFQADSWIEVGLMPEQPTLSDAPDDVEHRPNRPVPYRPQDLFSHWD